MKFGIISDIHADIEALQGAVALLREKHVDQILCLGDLVERGPHGDAVASYIQSEGITCIAGNHDLTAEANLDWYRKNADTFQIDLAERQLTPETLAFLKQLPHTLLVPVDDQKSQNILMAHGTPWSEVIYLFPGSLPALYKRVVRHAGLMQAQVVLLGHTHVPMMSHMDGVHIFNPGSVAGTYTAGSRSCATLTFPECAFEVFEIGTGQTLRPSQPVDYEEEPI